MHKRIFLIIIAIFLLFSGCAKPVSNETEPTANEELEVSEETPPINISDKAVTGGEINIGIRNPITLNPILNEQKSIDQLLRLVFEPLVELDQTLKPVPALAKSWTFSQDNLSLTLNLRDDVIWHDGTKFTADDVLFTFSEIQKAPENSIYKNRYKNILSVNKSNSYTVVITYVKPYSGALYSLSLPIIPAHYYSGRMSESSTAMKPVGNGQFAFKELEPMKKVVLSATDSVIKGRPNVDTVNAQITPDIFTDIFSYEQNLQDIVAVSIVDWRKYSTTKQSIISWQPTSEFEFLGFNLSEEPFVNHNFRKATAHLVPKKDIIDSVYLGTAVSAETPVNPLCWYYEKESFSPEYNTNTAKELIKQFPDLKELSILANQENELRVNIAKIISEEFNKIGIRTKVVIKPFDEYKQDLNSGNFDMFVGGYTFSLAPDFAFAFHSSSTPSEGNVMRVRDINLDSALNLLGSLNDETEFSKAASNFQKLFANEIYCVSIAYRKNTVLSGQNKVLGAINPIIDNPFVNIGKVFKVKHNEVIEQTGE